MLGLERARGLDLWRHLIEGIESYLGGIQAARVTPELDPARVRACLDTVDFAHPREPLQALEFALQHEPYLITCVTTSTDGSSLWKQPRFS
jgi:hypothetical protein